MGGMSPVEPQWIGRYRVLRKLGEGGMGQVFLARSEGGRTVAVKVIRPEVAHEPEFRRRFRLEVEAARKVGGACTAPVLDADTEAAVPWVATGYVAGPALHTVVAEDYGPLPEHSVRTLAHGLASALQEIHAAGLVHRDLKPSNVLVTVDGPRVIDFGIARALHPAAGGPATQTGAVLGSPGFMSPEQVRGERVTAASDVFCYGAVLAFAATGRLPFGTPEGGLHALMFRVATEEPDLTGLAEGPLRDVIVCCLAKDPAGRPDVAELVEFTRQHAPAAGPWLPGEVLAGLGRHAAQLLDAESPAAAAPVRVATVADAPVGAFGPPLPLPLPEPTAPREDVDTTESPRGMAIALQALMVVLGLLMLGYLAFQVDTFRTLADAADAGSGLPDAEVDRAKTLFGLLENVEAVVMVPTTVMWLLWFWRVRINAEAFAPGRHRYRRGWALWGWFTPVASLWIPKLITDDIWAASDPNGGSARRVPRGFLNAWWVFWVVELIFGLVGFSGVYPWYDTDDPVESMLLLLPNVIDNVLMIAAAGFATAVVGRLTAMQVQRRAAGA
ncbi:protein kinase domain-containing protein [Streptoverticillium reticulum]|uniref:protein kinase domain-containing protein n=1 Tax=Streptoverticillium reticulum TaxID=1433415 RepID=UPI0039BF5623